MRNWKRFIPGLAFMLILAGCGTEEKTGATEEKPRPKAAAETKEPESDTEKSNENEGTDEGSTEAGSSGEGTEGTDSGSEMSAAASGEVMNPFIAEDSQGDVEVVYTNTEPGFTHDMDGFKVSVDGYQIVKVTDISEDYRIPFKDQTEGYVVSAKVTLENGTGKAAYYNNSHKIQLGSSYEYVPSNWKYLNEEKNRPHSKTEDEIGKYGKGEKVSGILNFLFTNEQFETLKTVKPKYIIEGGMADNSEFKDSFRGDSAAYDFIYSDESKQASDSQPDFYQDKLTAENIADKEMIMEKTDINETKEIGDVKITLDGVQYTEITPTEANKPRFRNFEGNGIVALTVKFKIDNQSKEDLTLASIGSILSIDKNRGRVLNEGMVEPSEPRYLEAGASGEKLHVFLFNKDEFEIFKKFELEFGPLLDADSKRLFKERKAVFAIPR